MKNNAIRVEAATLEDAAGMSHVLGALFPNNERPTSADHMRSFYIEHPDSIRCSVAVDSSGDLLGFQSLKIASEGNVFDRPVGWGVIGTYVGEQTMRTGVGRALFASSLEAARETGLAVIDATIAKNDERALGFYDAMGFKTYQIEAGSICKKLLLKQ